jgi:hypothetical protein
MCPTRTEQDSANIISITYLHSSTTMRMCHGDDIVAPPGAPTRSEKDAKLAQKYPSAVTDNVNSGIVFATGATTQHPPFCAYLADVSESPAPTCATVPPNYTLRCKDYFVKDYLVSFLHSELSTFCKKFT